MEYILKWHYETKHKKYSEPTQEKEKAKKLKANLDRQQIIFKKQSTETEKNTQASYTVSYLIAKTMKPFMEGEFINECMSVVREVVLFIRQSMGKTG